MTHYHLAQANWARRKAPLEELLGFVDRLDEINALAESSPGFVWRFVFGEGDDATEYTPFDDDGLVFNFSVWESLEDLKHYVYDTDHIQLLRGRAQWFHTPDRAPSCLWWVPAGTIPTTTDAEARFRHLWEHGPTAEAFTLEATYPPPT